MKSAREEAARAQGLNVMTPRMWFVAEAGAEQVARRHEIWALLGWYHHNHVVPHLTVRGALRRLWWRLTGQHQRLLSPWEAIVERTKEIKAERELRSQMAKDVEPPRKREII